MGTGGYSGEVFSLSGILKLTECIFIFTALLVHRLGDHGNYVFFGTTTGSMAVGDEGMDLENLGNGTLVTYAIISTILLVAYVIDGRYAVQGLFLEPLWNFIAVWCFSALGIKTIMVWSTGKKQDDMANTEDYAMAYGAGLALGSICVILGLVYLIDFWVSFSARKRIRSDAY